MGGVGNLFQGTSTPLHQHRGRHAPPRAPRFPIPCRRVGTGRGMVARRIDPGSPLPWGGVAPRGTGLRRGRPAANPDRTPGAKHASGRAGHLLRVVGVVRGPGTRHEVRPAGQLRTRPCSAWPRSTGDPRAGRRRLGESERGHAWAAARITPHQANRPLLFLVNPPSMGRVTPSRDENVHGNDEMLACMAKDDDFIDDHHQGTRVEEERSPRSGPMRELRSRPCDICGKPSRKASRRLPSDIRKASARH
jgi:hypothetical protein